VDFELMVQLLAQNAERIPSLAQVVSPEQARWRPDADSWSILEVVNHLYDEEREDFRVRLDMTLRVPDQPWPPIDPAGWVVERGYNARDLETSLRDYVTERRRSLEWLETLEAPDWDASHEARFGLMKAGDILASWVGHDWLHTRQLVELHRAFTLRLAEPYQLDYAGPW
jgi:hypothetical protein